MALGEGCYRRSQGADTHRVGKERDFTMGLGPDDSGGVTTDDDGVARVVEPRSGPTRMTATVPRRLRAWPRSLVVRGVAPLVVGLAAFVILSLWSPSPARSGSSQSVAGRGAHLLAFTGVGKDVVWLAVIGALLVVVGGMLLFDAPRRLVKKLAYLDPRHLRPGSRPDHDSMATSVPGPSSIHAFDFSPPAATMAPPSGESSSPVTAAGDENGGRISVLARATSVLRDEMLPLAVRFVARRGGAVEPGPAPQPSDPAPSPQPFPAYRGLAPGWYRDEADLSAARFWDGSTLSETTRPIATPSAPESPRPTQLESYQGLAPGWYRDDADPTQARYWDGAALGEERRPVTPSL